MYAASNWHKTISKRFYVRANGKLQACKKLRGIGCRAVFTPYAMQIGKREILEANDVARVSEKQEETENSFQDVFVSLCNTFRF
jgi:hypothetical protein